MPFCACVSPKPANDVDSSAAPAPLSPLADRAGLGRVLPGERLARYQAALRRCLPGDDLAEDLYFGWSFDPYQRASLAVAVKAMAVIEREERLRQQQRGVLGDERIAAIYAWLDGTLLAERGPVAADHSKTHERPATSVEGLLQRAPSYFTFVDRATMTACSRTIGDLDLLASVGFGWYAWDGAPALTSAGAARRARAESMGCALLQVPARFPGERSAPPGVPDPRVQPLTLAQLLAGEIEGEAVPAVTDLAGGEELVGMLARRQLLRGVTGGDPLAAIGMDGLGTSPASAASAVRAAMWLQALAGQRLGVFEGWRDVRDGTMTPYASRLDQPEYLEAVAHTALDVLRFSDEIASCRTAPRVGLAIPPEFVSAEDPNRWTPAAVALFGVVHAAGQPFDLVPTGRKELLGRYAIGVVIDIGGSGGVEAVTDGRWTTVSLPFLSDQSEYARQAGWLIARQIESQSVLRSQRSATTSVNGVPSAASAVQFRGQAGGEPEPPCVIRRASADGRVRILVNCGPVAQRMHLEVATPKGGQRWTDRLTGEVIGSDVGLGPWQVRLLVR
jgi:hypothetical protein